MQRAVGVPGPRPGPLRLVRCMTVVEPARVEAEHGFRRLDHHAHLVMVLATGETGPARGRAHFDQQDRRVRERRDLRHRRSQPWVHGFALQGEDTEDAFMHPVQRLTRHEALERFDAQGELPKGK
jgi:hypothetical protein